MCIVLMTCDSEPVGCTYKPFMCEHIHGMHTHAQLCMHVCMHACRGQRSASVTFHNYSQRFYFKIGIYLLIDFVGWGIISIWRSEDKILVVNCLFQQFGFWGLDSDLSALWKAQGIALPPLACFLRQDHSLNPKLSNLISFSTRLVNSHGPPASAFRVLGLQVCTAMPILHVSPGDLNSGPHSCAGSPLSTELSPQSPCWSFLGFLFKRISGQSSHLCSNQVTCSLVP